MKHLCDSRMKVVEVKMKSFEGKKLHLAESLKDTKKLLNSALIPDDNLDHVGLQYDQSLNMRNLAEMWADNKKM